jgi:hypothetical protein
MKKLFCILALLLCFALLVTGCKDPLDPSAENSPAGTPSTEQTPPTGQTPPNKQPSAANSFEQLSAKEQAFYLLHYEPLSDNTLSSYTIDMQLSISGSAMGLATTASSQHTLKVCRPSSGDLFYLQDATTSIHMSQGNFSQTITQQSQEGYANGKMFSACQSSADEEDYAVFSHITAADYLRHREAMENDASIQDLNSADCTTVTCEKVTGGYKAQLSGFTAAGLEKMAPMWRDMTDLFGAQVADVHLTLSVDEELMPQSLHLELSFALAATPTQMQINATYSGYNTTTPTAPNLSSYREIADLRVVDILEKAFSEAEDAKNLSFDFAANFDGNALGNSTQESEVNVSFLNGVYSFFVDETINGSTRITQYANGKIKQTTNGGSAAQQDITDGDARRWIHDYIQPVSLDLAMISEVSAPGNRYTVRMDKADPTYIVRLLSAYGVSEEDVTARAMLTVRLQEDGSLYAIEYLIMGKVTISGTAYDFTYWIDGSNYNFS